MNTFMELLILVALVMGLVLMAGQTKKIEQLTAQVAACQEAK